MLSLWLGAADQGLAYAGLALGTYLTLRVLNFPDLTVDGSFALGGGTAAVLISQGAPVPVALAMAILFGCLAGLVTGLIHTRLGVNDLFAGMLTTSELFILDILRMKQQMFEQAALTGKELEAATTVKRSERVRKGWQEWPFEGEFWADEVGYYKVDVVPSCPASMRKSVK